MRGAKGWITVFSPSLLRFVLGSRRSIDRVMAFLGESRSLQSSKRPKGEEQSGNKSRASASVTGCEHAETMVDDEGYRKVAPAWYLETETAPDGLSLLVD